MVYSMTNAQQQQQSMSAEEALAKAKEIAARYAASTAPAASTTASTTTTTTTAPSKGKRKRWGVAPDSNNNNDNNEDDDNNNEDDAQQKRLKAAQIAAALAATTTTTTTTTTTATTATSSPTTSTSEPVLQRVWIKTSKERPARHFVEFLQDKLQQQLQQHQQQQQQNDDDNKQNNSKQNNNKQNAIPMIQQLKLAGRGAPGEAPTPGMPQQPLHVVIQGTDKAIVEQVETAVEVLLQQAEEAVVTVPLDDENENDDENDDENKNDRALALTGGSYSYYGNTTGSSAASTYRPASVAQLIGQANLPSAVGGDGMMNTADWVQGTVQVPGGVVGFIIGRGGENITSMQAKTGAKVQIQKEHELQPGQTMRTITLSAPTQAALEACREIVVKMVQEKAGTNFAVGGSSAAASTTSSGNMSSRDERLLQQALAAGHEHVTIQVPDADVGLIIGKQGSTIRSIQEQSGASIQIPPAADNATTAATATADNNAEAAAAAAAAAAPTRTLHITHPTLQGAEHAKQLIQNVLDSKPSFASSGGGTRSSSGTTASQAVTIQVPVSGEKMGLYW